MHNYFNEIWGEKRFLKQHTNNNQRYFVKLGSWKFTEEPYLIPYYFLPFFLFFLYYRAEGFGLGIDFILQSHFPPYLYENKICLLRNLVVRPKGTGSVLGSPPPAGAPRPASLSRTVCISPVHILPTDCWRNNSLFLPCICPRAMRSCFTGCSLLTDLIHSAGSLLKFPSVVASCLFSDVSAQSHPKKKKLFIWKLDK